jgi:hypothetical protein
MFGFPFEEFHFPYTILTRIPRDWKSLQSRKKINCLVTTREFIIKTLFIIIFKYFSKPNPQI